MKRNPCPPRILSEKLQELCLQSLHRIWGPKNSKYLDRHHLCIDFEPVTGEHQAMNTRHAFWFGLIPTCLLLVSGCCQRAPSSPPPSITPPPVQGHAALRPVNTFSVVGFDPVTGELGVAVQSKFFNVGSVVPWAQANVGAIATQSYANTAYGPEGLKWLSSGKSAAEARQLLTEADDRRDYRQLGIVDAKGNSASFTGSKCNDWAGQFEGKHFCVQGNLLAGPEVVRDMATAYTNAQKVVGSRLADWLMASLEAGQAAGGDKRGKQSAALLVVRENGGFGGKTDRFIDLQVEDHPTPILELRRLYVMHQQFFKSAHRPPAKPAR